MFHASALNSDLGRWDVARVFRADGMFSGNKAFVGTGVEKVRDQREELASNNVWRTERCSMYTCAEMNNG